VFKGLACIRLPRVCDRYPASTSTYVTRGLLFRTSAVAGLEVVGLISTHATCVPCDCRAVRTPGVILQLQVAAFGVRSELLGTWLLRYAIIGQLLGSL
jgi:hypothetical protein